MCHIFMKQCPRKFETSPVIKQVKETSKNLELCPRSIVIGAIIMFDPRHE